MARVETTQGTVQPPVTPRSLPRLLLQYVPSSVIHDTRFFFCLLRLAQTPTAKSSTAASGNSNDPQSSLCLDPSVIATVFGNDGQDVPTAGQVASATSSNDFINFCLTTSNLPLTQDWLLQSRLHGYHRRLDEDAFVQVPVPPEHDYS